MELRSLSAVGCLQHCPEQSSDVRLPATRARPNRHPDSVTSRGLALFSSTITMLEARRS